MLLNHESSHLITTLALINKHKLKKIYLTHRQDSSKYCLSVSEWIGNNGNEKNSSYSPDSKNRSLVIRHHHMSGTRFVWITLLFRGYRLSILSPTDRVLMTHHRIRVEKYKHNTLLKCYDLYCFVALFTSLFLRPWKPVKTDERQNCWHRARHFIFETGNGSGIIIHNMCCLLLGGCSCPFR